MREIALFPYRMKEKDNLIRPRGLCTRDANGKTRQMRYKCTEFQTPLCILTGLQNCHAETNAWLYR